MAKVDPAVASFLSIELQYRPGEVKEIEGKPVFHDTEGETTLLDPDDGSQWFEARANAPALLFIGVSDGSRIDHALSATRAPVIVTERYPSLLRYALSRHNWSQELESRRLRLVAILGQDPESEIAIAKLSLFALSNIPGIMAVPSSTWWERAFRGEICPWMTYPGLYSQVEGVFPEIVSESKGIVARLRGAADHYDHAWPPEPDQPLRFWGVVQESTAAVKTILGQLFSALRELGHQAHLEVRPSDADRSGAYFASILESKPDCLISAIRSSDGALGWLKNFFQPLTLTYLTDAPWLDPVNVSQGFSQNDLLFSPEEQYSDWVQERCGVGSTPLPLACSYANHAPCPDEELVDEIRFIGNVSDPQGLLSSLSETQWNALVELFWEHCDDHACGDLYTFLRDAKELCDWSSVPAIPHVLWGSVYRLSMIEALEGLPLGIYGGKSWLKLLRSEKLRSCYRGWLEPTQELPREMAKGSIHLNLTSLPNYYSGNMRTYDAAGLGCCVLHDRKRDVLGHYVEDEEMVFFSGRENLRSRAEELLADPNRVFKVGHAARARTLKDHTYIQRAEVILSRVREEIARGTFSYNRDALSVF